MQAGLHPAQSAISALARASSRPDNGIAEIIDAQLALMRAQLRLLGYPDVPTATTGLPSQGPSSAQETVPTGDAATGTTQAGAGREPT